MGKNGSGKSTFSKVRIPFSISLKKFQLLYFFELELFDIMWYMIKWEVVVIDEMH